MKKKKNRYLTLLLILLAVSVGYAALSTQLKINGTTNISKNTWSVYWDEESISITQGSKGNTEPDVVNGDDGSSNTKVTWEVTLDLPGDFYEFTIDAANAGTVDAMITGITPTVPANLPSYISYSVTYANGTAPANNHLLAKGTKSGNTIIPTTQKYKVRVEYLDTVTPDDLDEIDDEGDTYQFSYQVTYGQATNAAIDLRPPVVESCPNCVFFWPTGQLYFRDTDQEGNPQTVATITNSTNDYREVKKDGQKRRTFIGAILDNDNKMIDAYVCVVKNYSQANETAVCAKAEQAGIVGGYSNCATETSIAVYNQNKNTLNTLDLYNDYCEEDEYGVSCNYGTSLSFTDKGVVSSNYTEGTNHTSCYSDYDGDIMCGDWVY